MEAEIRTTQQKSCQKAPTETTQKSYNKASSETKKKTQKRLRKQKLCETDVFPETAHPQKQRKNRTMKQAWKRRKTTKKDLETLKTFSTAEKD